MDPNDALTEALDGLASGQPGAVDRVMPVVYDRLKALARQQLNRQRPGQTLQPTALVHEAYLRLLDQRRTTWQSEAHFFAIAAQAMRRVLLDHARTRACAKRGGRRRRLPLSGVELGTPAPDLDLIALDVALQRLATVDVTGARIVEMRFFAGMEMAAIADVLGVTERTVRRHWVYAKAWLGREMLPDAGTSQPGER